MDTEQDVTSVPQIGQKWSDHDIQAGVSLKERL